MIHKLLWFVSSATIQPCWVHPVANGYIFRIAESTYPKGSMYGIYGNIYHQYTPNVSIYTSTMDPMGIPNRCPVQHEKNPKKHQQWLPLLRLMVASPGRKSTGLGPATPEMAFVHVNMEVGLGFMKIGIWPLWPEQNKHVGHLGT